MKQLMKIYTDFKIRRRSKRMTVKTIFVDDDKDEWNVRDGQLYLNVTRCIADAREFANFIYTELAKAEPEPGSIRLQIDHALDNCGQIDADGEDSPVDSDVRVDHKPKIDLSNNRVPFGLLGPEEQRAFRDAYRAGQVVDRWNWECGWIQLDNRVTFMQNRVYRIRKKT